MSEKCCINCSHSIYLAVAHGFSDIDYRGEARWCNYHKGVICKEIAEMENNCSHYEEEKSNEQEVLS